MVQKNKRINLTISQKYPLMEEIINDCRKKGKSISDYLCNIAVKDYNTSKSTTKDQQKEDDDNVKLPTIDKIIDYMLNTKMDLANEIIRLANNKEISVEKIADIYLGISALKIQLDNTQLIQKVIQPIRDKGMLFSKRSTLNKLVVDLARGNLINMLKKEKEEKERTEKIGQSKKRLKDKNKDELEDYEIVEEP